MTKKELRKQLRELGNMEVLMIKDWGKAQKIGERYAICKGEDDSDPMTDYSAWTYGCRVKWIVEWVSKDLGLE